MFSDDMKRDMQAAIDRAKNEPDPRAASLRNDLMRAFHFYFGEHPADR